MGNGLTIRHFVYATTAFFLAIGAGTAAFIAVLLEDGDVVVAVGTADELRAVEEIFAPGQAVAG